VGVIDGIGPLDLEEVREVVDGPLHGSRRAPQSSRQSRRLGEAALCLLSGRPQDVDAKKEWETVSNLFRLTSDEQSCLDYALLHGWHERDSYSFLDILSLDLDIKMDWIESTILAPDAESIQSDGRIRKWKKIFEADNKYLRVVLLEDGITVHNAFFDRRFKE